MTDQLYPAGAVRLTLCVAYETSCSAARHFVLAVPVLVAPVLEKIESWKNDVESFNLDHRAVAPYVRVADCKVLPGGGAPHQKCDIRFTQPNTRLEMPTVHSIEHLSAGATQIHRPSD